MVLAACRRLLGGEQDAEDVFQATFLVLARKAGALAQPGLLGNWLYAVACRCAREARARGARQTAAERRAAVSEAAAAGPDPADWGDVRAVLDEEIGRLPERLRRPLVLCYLEGRTNGEAAALIGCPRGTVASRLALARERLRARLARRGLTLSAAALTAALGQELQGAVLPAALAGRVARAALLFVAGILPAAPLAPGPVVALAERVVKSMALRKTLFLVGGLLMTGAFAFGGLLLA
jgi:RNA polymerase sigma factor (sigma-70 family)